jgi:excinuclease ABC subunit A
MLNADHIIDLGPLGGYRGGNIVAEGTPEEVAAHATSLTAIHLREAYERRGIHIAATNGTSAKVPRPKANGTKAPKSEAAAENGKTAPVAAKKGRAKAKAG